jgi:hypothetical protein
MNSGEEKRGTSMVSKTWIRVLRGGLLALVAAVTFSLTGDGGALAGGISTGIDPLSLLNLQVRPNVFIILDSSGSMNDVPESNEAQNQFGPPPNFLNRPGGDWPPPAVQTLGARGSKTAQGKFVLQQFISNNQTKASFSFGQYTQNGNMTNMAAGNQRFVYYTTDQLPFTSAGQTYPTPTANFIASTPGLQTALNTLQKVYAFQNIQNGPTFPGSNSTVQDNKLYVTEAGTLCTVTIPTGFYAAVDVPATSAGAVLAAQLQTSMNGTCRNQYGVGFNGTAFTFSVTVANFSPAVLNWGTQTVNSIGPVLNAGGADQTVPASPATIATGNATTYVMLSGTGGPNLNGPPEDMQNDFTPVPQPSPAVQPVTVLENTYGLTAGQVWNGNTFYVTSAGLVCAMVPSLQLNGTVDNVPLTDPLSNPPAAVPRIAVQFVTACAGATTTARSGPAVILYWGGGVPGNLGNFSAGWINNSIGCTGYQNDVSLQDCTNESQTSQFFPYLQPLFSTDANGNVTNAQTAGGGNPPVYTEATTGTGAVLGCAGTNCPTLLKAGLPANGSTPIAGAIGNMKSVFTFYYNGGTSPGPPVGPLTLPAAGPISTQASPHPNSVLIFVTDGDDTCASGNLNTAALTAAYQAQLLYTPLVGTENNDGTLNSNTNQSSMQTFMVGLGLSATPARLNAITNGGTGMHPPLGPAVVGGAWATFPTAAQLLACTTCQNAFLAPTATELSAALQTILDQTTSTGVFTAQASITDNVFEYVSEVLTPLPPPTTFSPNIPQGSANRYAAIVPVLFLERFTLPGFLGTVVAFQNVAGVATPVWPNDAGTTLVTRVSTDLTNVPAKTYCNFTAPAVSCVFTAGQLIFPDLLPVAASSPQQGIDRRIYTTLGNGSFLFSPYSGLVGTPVTSIANYGPAVTGLLLNADDTTNIPPGRVSIWPPDTRVLTNFSTVLAVSNSVDPAGDTAMGVLDTALGLPPDNIPPANIGAALATLQAAPLFACTNVVTVSAIKYPVNCPGGQNNPSPLVALQRARKEAREMILAFIAGAAAMQPTVGALSRVDNQTASAGEIIYQARPWVMADSTLSVGAVVGPPDPTVPAGDAFTSGFAPPGIAEWNYYVNGFITAPALQAMPVPAANTPNHGYEGFGLRAPDADGDVPQNTVDPRPTLKPVMTVVYQGANDGLHAFRAGPAATVSCDSPSTNYAACVDRGGEELWSFVPFDTLGALPSLMNPQSRANKTYMIASSLRFADVFFPAPNTFTVLTKTLTGVWRKVLYFGRGVGGSYYTALDVTDPNPFTQTAASSLGPIPLWNRGNPDTLDGTAAGTATNTAADATAYSGMGQTWAVPAISLVNPGTPLAPINQTTGRPGGQSLISFIAYVGSGYGDTSGCPAFGGAGTPCTGDTFYALDALNGDVVHSVNVDASAASNGGGLPRNPVTVGYADALVANASAYAPAQFDVLTFPNISAVETTRVYVGDIYGRLWKFDSLDPTFAAIPFADLGANQPIGTAASLLGMPPSPPLSPAATGNVQPFVYVVSGNDNRVVNPPVFGLFGFEDSSLDAPGAAVTPTFVGSGQIPVTVWATAAGQGAVSLFADTFDTGFVGTLQPATAFDNNNPPLGRVFFGGTRFNQIGPANPCRSSFDSEVFALAAQSGGVGFDISTGTNPASYIYTGTLLTSLSVLAAGTPTSSNGTSTVAPTYASAGQPPPPPPPSGLNPTVPNNTPFNITSTMPSTAGANSYANVGYITVCQ